MQWNYLDIAWKNNNQDSNDNKIGKQINEPTLSLFWTMSTFLPACFRWCPSSGSVIHDTPSVSTLATLDPAVHDGKGRCSLNDLVVQQLRAGAVSDWQHSSPWWSSSAWWEILMQLEWSCSPTTLKGSVWLTFFTTVLVIWCILGNGGVAETVL